MKAFRNILFPLCIVITGILSGCNDKELGIDLVHIEGVSWACNVTTSYATFGSIIEYEEELEVVLPASDGDLLYMNLEDLQLYYRYRTGKGPRLTVSFDTLQTVLVYLNGKPESMELSGPSSLKAFRELTFSEVEQLSTLYLKGAISEDMLSTLKTRETALHGIGIVVESDSGLENLYELFSICRPKLLILDDVWSPPGPEKEGALSDLELLWIQGNVSESLNLVPRSKNLESLILADWETRPGEILSLLGFQKLRNLTIAESDQTSLAGIKFPESIQNIHLIDCDTLSNISKIGDFKRLNRLSLTGCNKVMDFDFLHDMKSLQWLSFPENISHLEFGQLSGQLTQLEVVELIGCTEIEDLAPLKPLQNLKALVLLLEKEQLTLLDSLKQLKLIVLTNEMFDDSPLWVKELRTTLPEAIIVPGSGLCLGSGWLLLLLPFILLFRYIFRRK